ncbi:MAG: hypothetical protein P8M72_07675 [Gammaproteobacteria bacterium]|nr:hypothetical protein [Gammaproteobacteria bacterium]
MPNYLRTILPIAIMSGCCGVVLAQFSTGQEYIMVNYAAEAEKNPVATLHARIASGEVTFEYKDDRGYLDSMLEALDILRDTKPDFRL